MKKKLLYGMVIVCWLVFVPPILGIGLTVQAEDVATYIEQGEQHRKNNQTQAELDAFLQADKIDPNNAEVLWRLARAYVDLGNVEKEKAKQRGLYKTAESYAKKGIQVDPNHSRCHTYDGVAVGKVALGEGSKEKVRLSAEV